MIRSPSRFRSALLATTLGGAVVLAGCAPEQRAPVGLGTATGAVAAGTLTGVAMRNKGPVAATAAVLGAGLVGGILGNQVIDRPAEQQQAVSRQIEADQEYQRRLDYERQSALQEEQVRKEIEEQRLYEQWRQSRGGTGTGTGAAAVNAPADVLTAQRYLTALGYYRGGLDGRYGPATRSAVMQFEDSQNLPRTGNITPSLVSRMRAAI
ncbi:MAG TPA: peptidoglycan-binding protein [Geminicoccaceae bacterium]|nr:peptidoglycan-binding protein [Geminicoccaceae bacterium]